MEEHMKKILAFVVVVMMLVSSLSLSVLAADNYIYRWTSGAYLYIDGQGNSPAKLDLYFRFDATNECAITSPNSSWGVDASGIIADPSQGIVGVGDRSGNTTLNYAFQANQIYHVVYDGSAGNGTTITINGNPVGTVGTTLMSRICNNMSLISIDNFVLTVNGNNVIDEDFSDRSFNGVNGDTNGNCVVDNAIGWNESTTPDPVHTHTWDGGVISGNQIIYTCTGCGETRTEPYNPTDRGWWLRIDGYAHIAKNVDRCDGPYEQNCGYVDFDMIMLPGENGHCQIRIFDSYEGSTRTYIEDNYLGYLYTYTEAEGGMSWNWGEMSVNNVRHIRYAYTDDDVKIYVDGQHVYTSDLDCTPAMHGMVFYVESGSILIDNLEFTDTRNNYMFGNNFESNAGDNDGDCVRVHLGDCSNGNHVASNIYSIGLAPTCTADGYRYWPCVVCGMEAARETIEKLGHNFGTYAQGATTTAATATADGTKTWTCSRCSVAKAYGVIPATGDYRGTLYSFDDASDENVTKYVLGGFNIEAGIDDNDGLSYPGDVNTTEGGVSFVREYTSANYHQFANVPTDGYTVSYDFRLDEIFDTNDTDGYGHTMYFWVGGESNVANNIGYDFDGGEFFMAPSTGSNYTPLTQAYELKADTWYNITFKFYSNRSTYEAYAKLFVNGAEILTFDNDDASFELPYNAGTQNFPLLFRTFGVKADYTNWAVGDINFEWINFRTPDNVEPHEHVWGDWTTVTPAQVGVAGLEKRVCQLCGAEETRVIDPLPEPPVGVRGDANGDGVVNVKDIKALKNFIVGNGEIAEANCDLNGDGVVNAKDLKALKTMVVNG